MLQRKSIVNKGPGAVTYAMVGLNESLAFGPYLVWQFRQSFVFLFSPVCFFTS